MATGRFCISNSTSHEFLNTIITTECSNDEFFQVWATLVTFFDYFEYQAWFFALIGSSMVGLSGVFPLFIIPEDEDDYHNTQGGNSGLLKFLLSFAVGGLLGDVFLHLLPEAWSNFTEATKGGQPSMTCGLWVLGGFLVFVIAEKLFNGCNYEEIHTPSEPKKNFKYECDNNNVLNESEKKELYKKNGYNGLKKINGLNNGFLKCDGFSSKSGLLNENYVYEKIAQVRTKEKSKHITGYLNLIANCVDNFTHGLAIGGSFLVSFRLGALTTFAILIHEIPHEIGDFAILLKSGFSRLDAAKAQIITATGGICGAFFAIMFSGDAVEAKTSWILPFTAGGFLHIGMVTILPELLQETDAKESLKQLSGFITGIIIMATLTIFFD